MTQVQQKTGLATTTLVLGIIAMSFEALSYIPLMFWLSFINWLIVPVAIIIGIVALVKKQKPVNTIVGLSLAVAAWAWYWVGILAFADDVAGFLL